MLRKQKKLRGYLAVRGRRGAKNAAARPGRWAGGARVEPKNSPPKKAKRNDPRLAALSRELRDRWLEAVRARPGEVLAGRLAGEKYAVCRSLPAGAVGADSPRRVKVVESMGQGAGVKRLSAA